MRTPHPQKLKTVPYPRAFSASLFAATSLNSVGFFLLTLPSAKPKPARSDAAVTPKIKELAFTFATLLLLFISVEFPWSVAITNLLRTAPKMIVRRVQSLRVLSIRVLPDSGMYPEISGFYEVDGIFLGIYFGENISGNISGIFRELMNSFSGNFH